MRPEPRRLSTHNLYERHLTPDEIGAGDHREFVGGLWDMMGELQFKFLVGRGLRPGDFLLDVGCGCLRGGIHFVRYLEPGHYFGIDVNSSLLNAGYDVEISRAGLQSQLPREHLKCTGAFDAASFGVQFDVALAQSLFTHLPPEEVARCLSALAPVVRPGGAFYATFFEAPPGPVPAQLRHHPGDVISYPDRDPFHCRFLDLVRLAERQPWRVHYIGDWAHPRAQRMVCFERL